MDAKEVAHRLNDPDEHELRAFGDKPSKHPELPADTSRLLDLFLGRDKPSRDHGELGGRPNQEYRIAYHIVIERSGKKAIGAFVPSS